ncbi:MAG: SCO family protein [Gelidibacter sp.]|nr:SCO family protein [Gelidibacter sp.]
MRYCLLILIFCLYGCDLVTKELPILSYKIDDNGNEIHYGINYEGFENQLGENFTSKDIFDRVFIANFFFTRCPSICPPMRTELIKIAETFQDEDDFMLISHTIDPENDTVDILKSYAEATGIPSEKWQFLRSSPENTKAQANQYMTNFRPNEDGTDFYHSSYVALVDKHKLIRGFYNVLVAEDVERLKEDIKILIKD